MLGMAVLLRVNAWGRDSQVGVMGELSGVVEGVAERIAESVTIATDELSDGELSNLWRSEQVLHAVARVMRAGKISEVDLGFAYLAVCECAVGLQALAGRAQRAKLNGCACPSCTCAHIENTGST